MPPNSSAKAIKSLATLGPSPVRAGTSAQNHSLTSDAKMSRTAIKMELSDKLIFDDERVFQRLRVHNASMEKLVTRCVAAMEADSTIRSSVEILREVAAKAERRTVQYLEDAEYAALKGDEEGDEEGEGVGVGVGAIEREPGKRTAQETKMYKPLVYIITQYCSHYG